MSQGPETPLEHRRYNYLPLRGRKKIHWPNGARIAVWAAVNVEYFHIDKSLGGHGDSHVPDVQGYSLRDYGSRIGIFRLMDVLDKHGVKASVFLNSDVCKYQPAIIKEGEQRGWEWLGHGRTNNVRLTDYSGEQERQIIREVKEAIATAVGRVPKGWAGPGLAETFNTPDYLAAEGFEYLCDWGCDDQPVPMRVQSGRMIILPVHSTISDIATFLRFQFTPGEYLQVLRDQFDRLYAEGAGNGMVMAIPLHPFVIGLPFRIKYLDLALEYIRSHGDVWWATGGEIADWYYCHYYESP